MILIVRLDLLAGGRSSVCLLIRLIDRRFLSPPPGHRLGADGEARVRAGVHQPLPGRPPLLLPDGQPVGRRPEAFPSDAGVVYRFITEQSD